MSLFRKISYRLGEREFKCAKDHRAKSLKLIERSVVHAMMYCGYATEPLGLNYDGAPAETCYLKDGKVFFTGRKRSLSWADWVNLVGFIEVSKKGQ